ncbi:uncharacterized protein LOC129592236 isoform X2 [Paramacrobiotus metropolitanus]|uniref:uncharacterized protein LOC129592236 isoform X2 n=1 Tax=Paramacrobiotus metropolitanus TaxID=2943436 RepID=UPI0024458C59|nr:uncharacterized protein LOC129592236 isoform X2 [Paramacrobiotus metropolitanus]
MLLDVPFDNIDTAVDEDVERTSSDDALCPIDVIKNIIGVLKTNGTLPTLTNIYHALLASHQSAETVFFKSVRASLYAAVRDGYLVQQIIEAVNSDDAANQRETHLAFSSPSSLCRSTPSPGNNTAVEQLDDLIARLTPKTPPQTETFYSTTSGGVLACQGAADYTGAPVPEMALQYGGDVVSGAESFFAVSSTATCEFNYDTYLAPGDHEVDISSQYNPFAFNDNIVMDALNTLDHDISQHSSVVKQEKENIDYFGLLNQYNMLRDDAVENTGIKTEPKSSPVSYNPATQFNYDQHFPAPDNNHFDQNIYSSNVKLGDLLDFTASRTGFSNTQNTFCNFTTNQLQTNCLSPQNNQSVSNVNGFINGNIVSPMHVQDGQPAIFPSTEYHNNGTPGLQYSSDVREQQYSSNTSSEKADTPHARSDKSGGSEQSGADSNQYQDLSEALLANLICNFPPQKRLLYEAIYVVLRDVKQPLGGHTMVSFVRVKCKFLETTTAGLLNSVGRVLEEFVTTGIARTTPEGLYTLAVPCGNAPATAFTKPQKYTELPVEKVTVKAKHVPSHNYTNLVPQFNGGLQSLPANGSAQNYESSPGEASSCGIRPTFVPTGPTSSGSPLQRVPVPIQMGNVSRNLPENPLGSDGLKNYFSIPAVNDVIRKNAGNAYFANTATTNHSGIQQHIGNVSGAPANKSKISRSSEMLRFPTPFSNILAQKRAVARAMMTSMSARPKKPFPVNHDNYPRNNTRNYLAPPASFSRKAPVPETSFSPFLDLFAPGYQNFFDPAASQKLATAFPNQYQSHTQHENGRAGCLPLATDLRINLEKQAATPLEIDHQFDGEDPSRLLKQQASIKETDAETDDLSDEMPFYKSCGLTINDHVDSVSPAPASNSSVTESEKSAPELPPGHGQYSSINLPKPTTPLYAPQHDATKKRIILKVKKIKPNAVSCDFGSA